MNGAGALRVSVLALVCGVSLVLAFAQPAMAAPDDDESADLEADEAALLPWGLELGAELELAYEQQAAETASEFTFDEVDLGWSGTWLSLELGIKYDTESGRGLLLEDAALRVEGGKRWPLFLVMGRQVLPFGRFETRFIEDPLVALAAEIDDAALVLGVAGDWGEVALGGLKGEHAPDGELDVVLSLLFTPRPQWSLGASWTQDLGEAVELRELRAERREEGAAIPGDRAVTPVAALGVFVAREGRIWAWQLEAVTALAAFQVGALDEDRVQPAAVNLELAGHLSSRWAIATRIEAAAELPDAPELQYGLAGTFAPARFLSVTAEALRGDIADEPDRTLLSLQIALEF